MRYDGTTGSGILQTCDPVAGLALPVMGHVAKVNVSQGEDLMLSCTLVSFLCCLFNNLLSLLEFRTMSHLTAPPLALVGASPPVPACVHQLLQPHAEHSRVSSLLL